MENYVKVVLYAYPTLKEIGEEYKIHIQNKAILSYKSQASAQALAEYIAGEIVCKQNLEWLKDGIERTLDKLDETERALVEIRYFGGLKKKALQRLQGTKAAQICAWTESKYFRRQNKLLQKIGGIFKVLGITEERFLTTFAKMDVFCKLVRFVEEGRDGFIVRRERGFLAAKA